MLYHRLNKNNKKRIQRINKNKTRNNNKVLIRNNNNQLRNNNHLLKKMMNLIFSMIPKIKVN
jgi:hypothetical protein